MNFLKLTLGQCILTVLMVTVPWFSSADADAEASRHFELVIEQGKVQLEANVIRVTQGQLVKLSWQSDEALSLHLHGYDIEFDVSPDQAADVSFEAHATGRFPITRHGSNGENGHGHETLLYIEIYPD